MDKKRAQDIADKVSSRITECRKRIVKAKRDVDDTTVLLERYLLIHLEDIAKNKNENLKEKILQRIMKTGEETIISLDKYFMTVSRTTISGRVSELVKEGKCYRKDKEILVNSSYKKSV